MKTVVPRPAMRLLVRYVLRPTWHQSVPLGLQRSGPDALARIRVLPRGIRAESVVMAGQPAELLAPPGASTSRVILFLHGGGFVTCGPQTHRALAAHLAEGSGCAVYLLDYRLAPEHPWPVALDDGAAAFAELSARYDEIVVAGDSVGGWLSVALAERLRDAGGRVPVALGLISPVVDLTSDHRSLDRDDMLQQSWLDFGTVSFAAQGMPIIDDVKGLPPTTIHVGEAELLRPDSDRLAAALREAGVPVELTIVPGMWHVWHIHAGLFPEATQWAAAMGAALAPLPR